mgnify:CR=1 FL=1
MQVGMSCIEETCTRENIKHIEDYIQLQSYLSFASSLALKISYIQERRRALAAFCC